MKLSKMFPRKYATGKDLQGKPITLTIASVRQEKMHPGRPGAKEEVKWVVYFETTEKGVILSSKTLAYQIHEAIGGRDDDEADTTEWIGKRIELYPVPMRVAGQDRVAIRARKAANGNTTLPQSLQDQD